MAVCLAAAVIVAVRAAPAPGEPDVHDRQLDVILAAPLLAAAVWLSVGWSTRLGPATPWSTREVLAAVAFLAGASFLLLGTRLTARIRWALGLPLLALPVVTGRPPLLAALIAGVLIATTGAAVRQLRTRRRTALGRTPAPPPRLPSWRAAGVVVGALAVALAVVAIASGPVPLPGPGDAAQSPAAGRAP